jgi:hypothetical protein
MAECTHGLDDRTCSICKHGLTKPKRTRRSPTAPKAGTFVCSVCGVKKNLDQVRTKHDPVSDSYPNNPDNICRHPCNDDIVASRKEQGGTRQEAIERVRARYLKVPPEVVVGTQAEAASEEAAGQPKGSGQGFQIDQNVKDAIADHAVALAMDHYSAIGKAKSVGDTKTWDIECELEDGTIRHVEVKGTTTDGTRIILTKNQVDHYQDYPNSALYVVPNIKFERVDGVVRIIDQDHPSIFDPWDLDTKDLQTIHYHYSIPGQ